MILDGKAIAAQIRGEIKAKVEKSAPGLAFLLIGDDPASHIYVAMKEKACREVGFHSRVIRFPETVTEDDLIAKIEQLASDDNVHGILVQQPLPAHISTQSVVAAVPPEKDVDGFHPLNLGKLLRGDTDGFFPCTPLGICTLLERSQIDPSGKHVVIVGRSNIVGKPLAAMLAQKAPQRNATVTLAHSGTRDLSALCRRADILIAATGHPHLITAPMVQEGAIVIDVGIHRTDTGTLCGDVDFDAVAKKAAAITPVPGGVGPMTIATLLQNTYESFARCTR